MASYNSFDSSKLIKTLAADGANKEELLYRLKYYLQQIKKLETKAVLLEKAIESEASFQASQDKWIRQATAADRLNAAKLLLQEEKDKKEAEKLMKESYKLIETLRKEITGEETTFKIAFDVGGTKKGHVYELKLSLSEILDSKLNFTHLSFASSSKVGNATSTMKLRFQEFKAADKRALYKKYSSQMGTKLFDISSEYKNFQKQTTELGLTLSPGRQYEFFKKAQAIQRYDKSTLSKLRDSVITDRLPFTEGVDFAYKDNSGYHFESLKSIIGKSPSLASFTTLLSTLQKVSSTMDQLVNNPMALEEYINFKMQEQQQGISKAAEQSIEESIGSQVVKPMLDQIFPQMTGIFDLSST